MSDGFNSLSNASLNTQWSKLVRGQNNFEQIVKSSEKEGLLIENIFELLSDETQCEPAENTGIDVGIEKKLARIKIPCETTNIDLQNLNISNTRYGTRIQTVVLIDKNNTVNYIERSIDVKPYAIQSYKFKIKE